MATTYSSPDASTGFLAALVAQNDAVVLPIRGKDWATVKWVVSLAGSGGITAEYTDDPLGAGSVNWKTPPYSRRLDQVTANPSVAPWANNTPVAGSYETPIPANCTAFRIRYQTAGTETDITISGGALYAGIVSATLYDITSAVNTAIDTGVLDLSGWDVESVYFVTPAGGSGAIKVIDDAGTAATLHTVPASAAVMVTLAEAGPGSATAVAATGTVPIGLFPKRMQFTSAAVVALTSRIRIEAYR